MRRKAKVIVMRVYCVNHLPLGKSFYAINLFGVVFAKGPLNSVSTRHEYIHTLQQREMLYIFFYLWYAVEWLLRLAYCRDGYKSYANLAFEREAYANQYNPHYPQQRRPYAWLHHLWHRESWREVWH